MELTEFLNARLAETAKKAQAALDLHPGPWVADHDPSDYEPYDWGVLGSDGVYAVPACGHCEHGGVQGAIADHIATHDPTWVLRDVAAKRKILDDFMHWQPHDPGFDALEPVIQLLAEPYATHPEYQESWRP